MFPRRKNSRSWSRLPLGVLAIGCVLPVLVHQASAQQNVGHVPRQSATIAALRRASLKDLARKIPKEKRPYAETLLTPGDSQKRAEAASWLAGTPEAKEFVLALLVRERDPKVMEYALMNVYALKHLQKDPRMRDVLRYVVDTNPEPKAVAVAVEQLRALTMHELRAEVTDRVERARKDGQETLANDLASIQDRAVNLDRGLMLPTFLRRSPPLFEKKVSGPSLRVLAFGDFGTGSEGQQKAAAAMREYHKAHPFDFGITLGDNFYSEGMPSPDDPRWASQFENLYGPMGIEIFACFGNHDEYDPDSPAAEILYSARSKAWRLPAQFYTFTAGPAQFFAIDCNDMSELQRGWLKDSLDKSTARWKVVYGHFPPYLAMDYANGEFTEFAKVIMPILKGRADVYLAGHHHSLQHVKTVDGVNLFISGGGGASTYEIDEKSPRKVFAKSEHGFAVIEVSDETFTVRFIDKDSQTLYETTIRK